MASGGIFHPFVLRKLTVYVREGVKNTDLIEFTVEYDSIESGNGFFVCFFLIFMLVNVWSYL